MYIFAFYFFTFYIHEVQGLGMHLVYFQFFLSLSGGRGTVAPMHTPAWLSLSGYFLTRGGYAMKRGEMRGEGS